MKNKNTILQRLSQAMLCAALIGAMRPSYGMNSFASQLNTLTTLLCKIFMVMTLTITMSMYPMDNLLIEATIPPSKALQTHNADNTPIALQGLTTLLNKQVLSGDKGPFLIFIPTDLLPPIARHLTNPNDLKNLGLACKTLQPVIKDLLTKIYHKEKWRDCYKTSVLKDPDEKKVEHMLRLSPTWLALLFLGKHIEIWKTDPKEGENHCMMRLAHRVDRPGNFIHTSLDTLTSARTEDGSIKVWNIDPDHQGNRCIMTLLTENGIISSFIQVDKYITATGSDNGTIKLWNINPETEGDRCILTLTGHTGPVTSLLKPTPTALVSGSGDATIKVWNIDPIHNNNRCIITLIGHTKGIRHLEQLTSTTIASVGYDTTVKIWDIDPFSTKNGCIMTLPEQLEGILSVKRITSTILATSAYDGSTKIWNIDPLYTGKRCILTLTHDPELWVYNLMSLSPSILLTATLRDICIWNIDPEYHKTRILKKYQITGGLITSITQLDESTLAVATEAGFVAILKQGKQSLMKRLFCADNADNLALLAAAGVGGAILLTVVTPPGSCAIS